MSDGELVRQTLAGRTTAFEELTRRWAGRVTALCHARTRRAGDAEDLAQETLLRGFRALATLSDPDKFGSWICGIAARTCLDWLKSKQRTMVHFSALGPDRDANAVMADGRAEPDLDRRDDCRRLMSEVEALPDECREAIMLYYYEDVTYRDLAAMLGVSAATVNARLTRGRALLRERLGAGRR
jgi:RNA polymerase sigma-70 factor (ECF subfamily)